MLQPDGTAAPVRHHFVPDDLFVQRNIGGFSMRRSSVGSTWFAAYFSHLSPERR